MLGMQPIDRTDKRQPNVQIAASIRAAILSGELDPERSSRCPGTSWQSSSVSPA